MDSFAMLGESRLPISERLGIATELPFGQGEQGVHRYRDLGCIELKIVVDVISTNIYEIERLVQEVEE
jgi:hypothetical protein